MSIVPLVSGGLDSVVMAMLIKEHDISQYPLFVDYGQLAAAKELAACRRVFHRCDLPEPTRINVSDFGKLISSGLTDRNKLIYEEAFLPGRNALFLLIGAAYAYQRGAGAVGIGLLQEESSLFPDQTKAFVLGAQDFLRIAFGRTIKVIVPLMSFSKFDVICLAKAMSIEGTYSCHAGLEEPCGVCISCQEFLGAEG